MADEKRFIMAKAIMVKFAETQKHYSYLCDFEVKEKDLLVVPAASEYKVVKVMKTRGLTVDQIQKAGKLVVCKVDLDEYAARKITIEMVQEIRNRLRARREEMEDMLIYQQLAEHDPEIKSLLNELKQLSQGIIPEKTD